MSDVDEVTRLRSELDTVRDALGNGADENLWPPGRTVGEVVKALVLRLATARAGWRPSRQDSFTVKRYRYGWVVKGGVPLNIVSGLIDLLAEGRDDGIIDGIISEHFGGTMCITWQEESELWRKELGL
jgi:hypothetical protein